MLCARPAPRGQCHQPLPPRHLRCVWRAPPVCSLARVLQTVPPASRVPTSPGGTRARRARTAPTPQLWVLRVRPPVPPALRATCVPTPPRPSSAPPAPPLPPVLSRAPRAPLAHIRILTAARLLLACPAQRVRCLWRALAAAAPVPPARGQAAVKPVACSVPTARTPLLLARAACRLVCPVPLVPPVPLLVWLCPAPWALPHQVAPPTAHCARQAHFPALMATTPLNAFPVTRDTRRDPRRARRSVLCVVPAGMPPAAQRHAPPVLQARTQDRQAAQTCRCASPAPPAPWL